MPTLLPRVSTRILCAVVLCASGCRTWQPVAIPRTGAEPASAVTRARVTYRDGRVSEVGQVRFVRDSMHATRAGVVFAVPADSLRSVEVRRLDWLRTLGLAAGILGTSLLFGG